MNTLKPRPTSGNGAIADVNTLKTVTASVAAAIKAAAMAEGALPDKAPSAELPVDFAIKPGVERWPVKTGTDADIASVGKNVIAGKDFGAGIVDTTVEELIAIPRPPGMRPATRNFDSTFHGKRLGTAERTIWRIEASIIVVKQESDGDYHLVLQSDGGAQMIGEIPTPQPPFVDAASPWLANVKVARKAVDDKLVSKLHPADFAQFNGKLVPKSTLPPELRDFAPPAGVESFVTPEDAAARPVVPFQTAVAPAKARITGAGFFDSVHGQTGVSVLNGIELHSVLKIEWL